MDVNQVVEPPFNKLLGFQVTEWKNGHVRIDVDAKPEHNNTHGIPHGGFLCSLLDVACSMPGIYCAKPNRVRRALTLSMNTNFVGQAKSSKLHAIGRIVSAGYKIFHGSAEVYDAEGTLLATAHAVFKYRKGSEDPEGMSLEDWNHLVST
ncbi:PaaI family thioesterase [Aestuariicella hydrocarbonica]|uniref:PaaI family thioesterase n=1 Tax=Pseudomaricurvus hydrocarbonicus TaxID=1470433 RepID=A0A9E5JYG6_9GAMM|nr:PaaI family thioesterase [Aestuariicella hydrocarbonica]NHO64427.1 PaaI family thioesterase [Aestuariicella hydrocarbonica]